ncbi:TNR25 factor, partial [Anseranas semipalmata]|nr:TNR25 factor [Anseranas semipalmata]
ALTSPCPQVVLAVLWLLASGSQPPGCQDCAVPQGPQGPVRLPARPRRFAAKPSCPPGMKRIDAAGRCCAQCPPGTYLHTPCSSHGNDSVCAACPAGTFLSQPNTLTKCRACYECDHQAFQSVLSNCSATSNVACGCEPGRFRSCLDERCNEFSCSKCQLCPGRLVQRPCSDTQDTLCGSCKPNFYAEGSECRPCHMSTPETCSEECQQVCGGGARGSGLEYILLGLTGPLFLGALAIYHKRRRLQHEAPAGSPLPTVPTWGCHSPTACTHTPTQGAAATEAAQCQVSACGGVAVVGGRQPWQRGPSWTWLCPPGQVWEHSPGTVRSSPESWALLHKCPGGATLLAGDAEPSAPQEPSTVWSPASHPRSPQRCALLQGSQLYAVINVVPVRRWKEFMRVLELRDTEIELVEMEVAHFRDQQYEMLKRWCQQTSATLDRIFAALEHMELAGCAEALRQSL